MTDLGHVQITPGRYLELRRQAAALPVEQAPSGLSVDLAAIEADQIAITIHDATMLNSWFDFDLAVLVDLVQGIPVELCRVCACSWNDPCVTDLEGAGSCHWVAPDLCSACREGPPA